MWVVLSAFPFLAPHQPLSSIFYAHHIPILLIGYWVSVCKVSMFIFIVFFSIPVVCLGVPVGSLRAQNILHCHYYFLLFAVHSLRSSLNDYQLSFDKVIYELLFIVVNTYKITGRHVLFLKSSRCFFSIDYIGGSVLQNFNCMSCSFLHLCRHSVCGNVIKSRVLKYQRGNFYFSHYILCELCSSIIYLLFY